MEKNKIIVPTGYMGSGSSAVTDLLSEVRRMNNSAGTFEYVFLHCPNGVFDLEDKLLKGNTALRSDEALHSFACTMRQLYDKKYWWVGHYNKVIGTEFWNITKEYIEELIDFKPDFYWYYQENVVPKMVPRLMINKLLRVFPGGKRFCKKPLLYSPMWISYVGAERFYKVTQDYIYQVFDLMGRDKDLVLDQLLLPHNLHRIGNYFKDDIEVFVVERDPRDMFIINKYYWSRKNEAVAYPTEAEEFCDFYRRLRDSEYPVDSEHVHRIRFEDMIYDYDETVRHIFEILKIGPEEHVHKKEKFKPEKSINNTQLFSGKSQYAEECHIIEENLREYLYSFPYQIEHNGNNIF